MKRTLILLFSVFLVSSSFAQSPNQEVILRFILDNDFITRDSGAPLSRDFLVDRLHANGDRHFVIEGDDILFAHYITFFKDSDDRKVILISEDGASVENRWVFIIANGFFIDSTAGLWPEINSKTISDILIRLTGDKKYTEEFIDRIAHSSYRIKHPNEENPYIEVLSGLPDSSLDLKLGEIFWNGNSFQFRAK